MLFIQADELDYFPASTPEADPHACMNCSASSPERSSTASADSDAFFSRNDMSFAMPPALRSAATPSGRESRLGRVNSPSNPSNSNDTSGYCFWPLRCGAMLFVAVIVCSLDCARYPALTGGGPGPPEGPSLRDGRMSGRRGRDLDSFD